MIIKSFMIFALVASTAALAQNSSDIFYFGYAVQSYSIHANNLSFPLRDIELTEAKLKSFAVETRQEDSFYHFGGSLLFKNETQRAVQCELFKTERYDGCDAEDLLIVHASMHGTSRCRDEKGAIRTDGRCSEPFSGCQMVTASERTSEGARYRLWQVDRFADHFEHLACKKLFILDLCHSGGCLDDESTATFLRGNGLITTTAKANEVAIDGTYGRAIEEAFSELADGSMGGHVDGIVTVAEFARQSQLSAAFDELEDHVDYHLGELGDRRLFRRREKRAEIHVAIEQPHSSKVIIETEQRNANETCERPRCKIRAVGQEGLSLGDVVRIRIAGGHANPAMDGVGQDQASKYTSFKVSVNEEVFEDINPKPSSEQCIASEGCLDVRLDRGISYFRLQTLSKRAILVHIRDPEAIEKGIGIESPEPGHGDVVVTYLGNRQSRKCSSGNAPCEYVVSGLTDTPTDVMHGFEIFAYPKSRLDEFKVNGLVVSSGKSVFPDVEDIGEGSWPIVVEASFFAKAVQAEDHLPDGIVFQEGTVFDVKTK